MYLQGTLTAVVAGWLVVITLNTLQHHYRYCHRSPFHSQYHSGAHLYLFFAHQ